MAAASASAELADITSRRGHLKARCGARKKTAAGTCTMVAGWGTDHLGYGQCKLHGGASPNGIKHAATQAARHLAVELDVEPHDALLWCVRVAAGEVRFYTQKISELEEAALIVQSSTTKTKTLMVGREEDVPDSGEALAVEELERTDSTAAHLHIWVEGRAQAVDRLARYSKMALDAGVEERRVRIVEQLGSELGDAFATVFAELKLTADQQKRAPAIVHRTLYALEAGPKVAA